MKIKLLITLLVTSLLFTFTNCKKDIGNSGEGLIPDMDVNTWVIDGIKHSASQTVLIDTILDGKQVTVMVAAAAPNLAISVIFPNKPSSTKNYALISLLDINNIAADEAIVLAILETGQIYTSEIGIIRAELKGNKVRINIPKTDLKHPVNGHSIPIEGIIEESK